MTRGKGPDLPCSMGAWLTLYPKGILKSHGVPYSEVKKNFFFFFFGLIVMYLGRKPTHRALAKMTLCRSPTAFGA